ncbi:hypothetical protein F5Y15DRAFT_417854 [Xylariaceae sp. FL0016]|nr:hypothetical protein F5Y15DRAFT_417854 [Xylariaceae sp. FL0016]
MPPSLLRSPYLNNVLSLANLAAAGAMTLYFKGRHEKNLEAHETRIAELEDNLRAHISLMDGALRHSEPGGSPRMAEAGATRRARETDRRDETATDERRNHSARADQLCIGPAMVESTVRRDK